MKSSSTGNTSESQIKTPDRAAFAPLTSFSNRFNSTFTGSDPCKRFMNSSASKLGRTDPRLRELPFPSLKDCDTVSGGVDAANTGSFASGRPPLPPFSVQLSSAGETLATSPEISAMTDLRRSFTSESTKSSNFGIGKAVGLRIGEISER